jgi:organic hydroperoxide reductase OsmC/OhrA
MAGHEYRAGVHWTRGDAAFTDNRFSRAHAWRFDGGLEVPASASPHVVRVPLAVEAAVDPEEAFVASIASCHMLWFLFLAARGGWRVDAYDDEATGLMGRNAAGRTAMLSVTLHPKIVFSGEKRPTPAELEALHHRAHEDCFIANSVTTEVRVESPADG